MITAAYVPASFTHMMSRKNYIPVALVVIIIFGFILRIKGNTFGLPYVYTCDERKKVNLGQNFLAGDFMYDMHHPSLLPRSLAFVFKIAHPFQQYFKENSLFYNARKSGYDKNLFFLWIGRCWMAVLDTFSIFLVFLLGTRVWDKNAGLIASGIYSVCPMTVIYSHYIKEDILLNVWTTSALFLSISAMHSKCVKNYIAAALACSMAFCSKYIGGLALLLLPTAYFLQDNKQGYRPNSLRRDFFVAAICGISFIAIFFIVHPSFFSQFEGFRSGFLYQVKYILRGHYDGMRITAWENYFSYYLLRVILPEMGLMVVVASLAGMALLWRMKKKTSVLLLGWFVIFYATIELIPIKPAPATPRYVLPLMPVFCVYAGISVVHLISRVGRNNKKWIRWIMAAACLALIFYVPTKISTQRVWAMIPDTRDRALVWINEHIPQGSVILAGNHFSLYYPDLSHTKYAIVTLGNDDKGILEHVKGRSLFFIYSSLIDERFLDHPNKVPWRTEKLKEIMAKATLVKAFEDKSGAYGYNNPVIRLYRIEDVSILL